MPPAWNKGAAATCWKFFLSCSSTEPIQKRIGAHRAFRKLRSTPWSVSVGAKRANFVRG